MGNWLEMAGIMIMHMGISKTIIKVSSDIRIDKDYLSTNVFR